MREVSEVIAALRSIAAAIAEAGIDGFGNQVAEQADNLEALSTPQSVAADVVDDAMVERAVNAAVAYICAAEGDQRLVDVRHESMRAALLAAIKGATHAG